MNEIIKKKPVSIWNLWKNVDSFFEDCNKHFSDNYFQLFNDNLFSSNLSTDIVEKPDKYEFITSVDGAELGRTDFEVVKTP